MTDVKVEDILSVTTVPAGAEVTYQWYANNTTVVGATNSNFTVDGTYIREAISCKIIGTGKYTCKVTAGPTDVVTKANQIR